MTEEEAQAMVEEAVLNICDILDLDPDLPINHQSNFGSYDLTKVVIARSFGPIVRALLK